MAAKATCTDAPTPRHVRGQRPDPRPHRGTRESCRGEPRHGGHHGGKHIHEPSWLGDPCGFGDRPDHRKPRAIRVRVEGLRAPIERRQRVETTVGDDLDAPLVLRRVAAGRCHLGRIPIPIEEHPADEPGGSGQRG